MRLQDPRPAKGARRPRKRIGRGPGSGHGKTACAGHKGQRSRTGDRSLRGFEGGQMPLHRRMPKRGFTNKFRISYHILNVEDLARFGESAEVTPESLRQAGVIGSPRDWGVKILGNGEAPSGLKLKVHKISRPAREKIERAGGTIELVK